MRQTCLRKVHELARKDERIFFVGSDLGVGTLKQFKAEMPKRFLMEGVSEANVVGLAAGLALEGKIVYVNTIATFLTRRCYEQVVLDACLHNVKIRLIGNGGGMVYAPLGPTHEATEDIAIMRALPRMTILAPADAEEMSRMVPATVDHSGPIYIRLGKGGDPVVTESCGPFVIGKIYPILEGRDATLITTGITLKVALDAAQLLAAQGISVNVLHAPTVKPLDAKTVLAYCQDVKAVVTVEEHTVIGGLGGAVAELLAEAGALNGKAFKRIGLPDVFPAKYGSQANLLDHYGISAKGVGTTVAGLLRQS